MEPVIESKWQRNAPAVTRRAFLTGLLAAGAGWWFAGWGWMRRTAVCVRAICGSRYPGPVRPLDPDAVRRPAEWNG